MNKKLLTFLITNIFLFISTIIVTYLTLSYGTVAGQVDTGENVGWFYIATFTVESNILLGGVAGITSFFILRAIKHHTELPVSIVNLYLVATSATMLTFLTVVFFLAPMRAASGSNYFEMLIGPMFFFHFFNPVISALAYIFLTGPTKLPKSAPFFSVIPMALYAIPYVVNVAILKNWPDFYGITFGGRYALIPLVFLVFCLVIFAISFALNFLRSKFLQKSQV